MGVGADFKKFVGNRSFIDVAVGIVVGIAVTMVVTGLVTSLINPLIGLAFHTNFSKVGNVTVNDNTFAFGVFFGDVVNFVIVLAVIFFVLVYPMMRFEAKRAKAHPPPPPTTRECPECCSTIPKKAKRCAQCGSAVTPLE